MARHPFFLVHAGAWIVLNGALWAVLYHTLRPWMTAHPFTAALLAGAIDGTIALPPLLKAAFPHPSTGRFPVEESRAAGDTTLRRAGDTTLRPVDASALYAVGETALHPSDLHPSDGEPAGSWASDLPLFAFFGMVPAGFFYSSLRHIQPSLLMGARVEVLIATTALFSLVIAALGCLCYLLPGSAQAEP